MVDGIVIDSIDSVVQMAVQTKSVDCAVFVLHVRERLHRTRQMRTRDRLVTGKPDQLGREVVCSRFEPPLKHWYWEAWEQSYGS